MKGDFIVKWDFAEKYSFVVSDAAQSTGRGTRSLLWVYYILQRQDIKYKSIVVMLHNLKQDTATSSPFKIYIGISKKIT